MESLEETKNAGGKDEDDVLTIEIDLTKVVRDFLKSKEEEYDGNKATD